MAVAASLSLGDSLLSGASIDDISQPSSGRCNLALALTYGVILTPRIRPRRLGGCEGFEIGRNGLAVLFQL